MAKILICTPSYFKNGKIAVAQKLAETLFAQQTTCTWEWYIPTEDCTSNKDMTQVNQNIAFKLNKGREIVLHNNFDALFWCPDDHVLTPTVLEQMVHFIGTHAIVSAPVRLRPSSMGMSHIGLMSYKDANARDKIGEGLPAVGADFSRLSEWYRKIKWEAPFEVAGGGLPMITREVLEKVKFRQEDKPTDSNFIGADLRFFSDAYRLGYKTLIVPAQIGHIDQGQELWLDEAFYDDLVKRNMIGELIYEYVLKNDGLLSKAEKEALTVNSE